METTSTVDLYNLPKSYVTHHRRAVAAILRDIERDAVRDMADADAHHYVITASVEEADRRFPNMDYSGRAYDKVFDWRTAVEEDVFTAIGRPELSHFIS